MVPVFTLFLIIFLEGYVVLSTELLAIRVTMPFTGSGTDTVSIIIAAVLMPLAVGYYTGGQFKPRRRPGKKPITVRGRLIRNLLIAAPLLCLGLSHIVLMWLFELSYLYLGIYDRLVMITLYALIFLVIPVYVLGQTVPLISNYFPRQRISLMTGKILFFSTLGSFMGAVFCTLVLMTFVGVHYTVCITIVCMAVLGLILSRKKLNENVLMLFFVAAVTLYLNSPPSLGSLNIVANNKYNLIQIAEHDYNNTRVMHLNHNQSSGIDMDTKEAAHAYIQFMEQHFIKPMALAKPPRDILVIGAGGFTLGHSDKNNNYTYIDIDGDLKNISEELFLKEKLSDNKIFEAVPARAFLYKTDQKYDLIVLDAFRSLLTVPEHLVTVEFFQQVKGALKPGGIVVGNYIVSPNLSDPFSIKLDNTIRRVFPTVNRQVIERYNGWHQGQAAKNVIYTYFDWPYLSDDVYTDNRNTSLFDKSRTVTAIP